MALMLLSSSCSQSSKPIHTASPNVSTAPSQNIRQRPSYITAESVIRKLASKEFKGRLTGTEENKKAAQYISDTFTTIGLEKYSKDSYMFSYTQEDTFDWLKSSKETSSPATVENRIKESTNAQHVIESFISRLLPARVLQDDSYLNSVQKFLKAIDINIDGIRIDKAENLTDEDGNEKYKVYSRHKMRDGSEMVEIPFSEESGGTQKCFVYMRL
ncbi:MAG: hypothetical protein GX660_27090 [Clostridiaceae bacterium]|nr:hypothetical protein [Clostridiaceae bacterium]